MKKRSLHVIPLMVLALLVTNQAYGYIDPGVGQFLWQLLFGFCAGALYLVERGTRFFARLLKRRR